MATARELYAWADDPERGFHACPLVGELRARVSTPPAADDLDTAERQVLDWCSTETARYLAVMEEGLVERVLLNCAPLSLVAGAWLQWLVGPAGAEDEEVLRVLARYASDVGVGLPEADRGGAFLGVLKDAGIADAVFPPSRMTDEVKIDDRSFVLPAMLLAMSRFPDEFRPEILGADLCLRTVGVLPPLRAVLSGPIPDALDLGVPRAPSLLGSLDRPRTLQGFGWAATELRRWSDALIELLGRSLVPGSAMAELLSARSRDAAVYHDAFLLEGRPLRAWFEEGDFDRFVGALGRSRLVRPGDPVASPLLDRLIAPAGPMFRVFTKRDLAVIERWIASNAPPPPPAPSRSRLDFSVSLPPGDVLSPARVPPREAFTDLLRRNCSPELTAFAHHYATDWLKRSSRGIERVTSPPRSWHPGVLRRWLHDQHERHDEQHAMSGELPMPSREELIDAMVQRAPLNLIDGAWLVGFTDFRHASAPAGYPLFATYWDELGNGRPELNHPRIYRDLLRSMGVDLPPLASREFAEWAGFRDESFDLPVYWLCVSRFPRTFQPELLGLNLAMELSGVGGTYRRDRFLLNTYGFDTRFADIHNTIDNVVTGHSAWAADAVDTYLSRLEQSLGAAGTGQFWNRIRVGYRSLKLPRQQPGDPDGEPS